MMLPQPFAANTLFDRLVSRATLPPWPFAPAVHEPSPVEDFPEEVVEQSAEHPHSSPVFHRAPVSFSAPESMAEPEPAKPASQPAMAPPSAMNITAPSSPLPQRREAPEQPLALQTSERPQIAKLPEPPARFREVTIEVPVSSSASTQIEPPSTLPKRARPSVSPSQPVPSIRFDLLPMRTDSPARSVDEPFAQQQATQSRVEPDLPPPQQLVPKTSPFLQQPARVQQPAETVINVTIGRLEVRSPDRARGSQKPPASPSAGRRPTLDEYLSKRPAGGGTP